VAESYAVGDLPDPGGGQQAGRPAVFCRFAGCSLVSREEDRSSAVCGFCDTDFVSMDGVGGASRRRGPGRCGAGRLARRLTIA
jgi:hypothetical protein